MPRILLLAALLPLLAVPASAQEPSPLRVDAEVRPAVSPLGSPVTLRATVTNVSNAPASFGHDGCPVWFEIDGEYRPYIGCAEFWEQVTLKPGESVSFGADEYPYLVHEPADFPLGPGRHRIQVRVGDAGRTEIGLGVEPPLADRAYLSGRILDDAGQPLVHARVTFLADAPDSNTDPPTEIHETFTREGGWFFLGGIRPNAFRMRVATGQGTLWWPGVPDEASAGYIRAPGGVYRDDLDLRFGRNSGPQTAFVGWVIEETMLAVVTPVAGAEVVAVPLPSDALDPALDGTDGVPDFRAPIRTTTDENGSYVLPVDPGAYRIVAGKPTLYGYRWSPQVRTWDQAQVHVIADGHTETVSFAIPPEEATEEAVITGQVLGYDPVTDGPPEPLEKVTVSGMPVFSFPAFRGRFAAVETDAEGRYRLAVLPTTPWFVQFYRSDYTPDFWPTGPAREPVDVARGTTTEGIDGILQPLLTPGTASIEGFVFAVDDPCLGIPGCLAPISYGPVAGALVRVTAAYPTFAPYELRARTDENGYFRVDGIWADAEGTLSYYVSAETNTRGPIYYPGGVRFEFAEPLPVFSGQVADAGTLVFEAEADQGGFLGGVVHDGTGEVTGALVRFHVTTAAGPRIFQTRSGTGGNWHLGNLPFPASGILSVEKEGWIPAYVGPDRSPRFRSDLADRIATWPAGDPLFDPAPLGIVLPRPLGSGPYLQAGRVQAERAAADSGDGGGGLESGAFSPRLRALQLHAHNVPGAFFYLVNAEVAAPGEFVVAGGTTSDNGTVIVTGLPQGVYYAYADKPGFQRNYFRSEAGGLVPITLNATTPAVLAEILLQPISAGAAGKGEGMVTALLNEPNPFHMSAGTRLYYRLLADEPVTVRVFDIRGREVTRLLDGEFRNAGEHTVPWDGTDARGRVMGAGVYVYRVDAAGSSSSRKMVLLP